MPIKMFNMFWFLLNQLYNLEVKIIFIKTNQDIAFQLSANKYFFFFINDKSSINNILIDEFS